MIERHATGFLPMPVLKKSKSKEATDLGGLLSLFLFFSF